MKNLFFLLVLSLVLVNSGCDQATVVGPQGPPGPEGNANVKIYTFGGVDFRQTTDTSVYISNISKDTVDNSAWFVYLVVIGNNSTSSFSIPGSDGSNSHYYPWSIYLNQVNRLHYFIIKDSGPGQEFSQIKVVRIYGGPDGKPQLPDIDFNSYDAVKEYYGIKE